MRARVTALMLVLFAGFAGTAQAYTPRVLPDSLGMNAQFTASPPGPSQPSIIGDATKLNAHLALLAANGVKVLRIGAPWMYMEPNPPLFVHTYTWDYQAPHHSMDYVITALANHGIRAAPVLLAAPPWAKMYNTDVHTAPSSTNEWGLWAGAFAARYGNENSSFWGPWKDAHEGETAPVVQTYEIWNEPNLPGRFKPAGIEIACTANTAPASQPGPTRYGQLFNAAYTRIKNADSDAVVMVGGLESRTLHNNEYMPHMNYEGECTVNEFLAGAKANMGAVTPDAIGLHIYNVNPAALPGGPIPTATDRINRAVDVRANIDLLPWAQSLPIHLNETGWGEDPNTIGLPGHDVWRGDAFAEMADVLLRSNCGIRQIVPHTWITADTQTTADDGEDRFGLAHLDPAAMKPAGIGYTNQVKTLQGTGALGPNPDPENLCAGRGPADIDGDGYLDGAGAQPDQYPGDPNAH